MAVKLESGRDHEVDEITITRQCDREYIEPLAKRSRDYDAVISTACGAGVQFLADSREIRGARPEHDFLGCRRRRHLV